MLLLRRVGREREARLPIDEARAVIQLLYDDFADLLRADPPRQQPRRRARPAGGAAREGKERRGAAAAAHRRARPEAPEAALPLRRLPAPLRARPRDRRRTCRARSRRRSRRTRTGSTSSSRAIAAELAKTPRWVYASRDKGFDPEAPEEPPAASGAAGARREPPCDGTPVISVEHVSKRYGDFVAVHDVSFEIRPRRVLLDARPLGLRQDDDAAHDRRLRGGDERRR